jgi:hypothetical protein
VDEVLPAKFHLLRFLFLELWIKFAKMISQSGFRQKKIEFCPKDTANLRFWTKSEPTLNKILTLIFNCRPAYPVVSFPLLLGRAIQRMVANPATYFIILPR